ncbi:hypothetical protein [Robinsoniella peoriensis]|uniref:hypothetical protein n=1 Tax=Robinsoniella peoriensis TaxID=180332 RepID=UPI003632C196
MLIVLSQKVDSNSEYEDELFNVYHYPSRYRNQIQEGDRFVYYQGNRYDKAQRYYFGAGIVGRITCHDNENYYAALLYGQRFEKRVPIYLPDGGYIEQLGYDFIRKSINPPWQSSVRPISEAAYNYILNHAGELSEVVSTDELKERLKDTIRKFYVGGDDSAIVQIIDLSKKIAKMLGK